MTDEQRGSLILLCWLLAIVAATVAVFTAPIETWQRGVILAAALVAVAIAARWTR